MCQLYKQHSYALPHAVKTVWLNLTISFQVNNQHDYNLDFKDHLKTDSYIAVEVCSSFTDLMRRKIFYSKCSQEFRDRKNLYHKKVFALCYQPRTKTFSSREGLEHFKQHRQEHWHIWHLKLINGNKRGMRPTQIFNTFCQQHQTKHTRIMKGNDV